jgi:predicted transposase YdaD
MVKKADIGSKRLISLAHNAWVQWITQQTDITAQEVLASEFQWISRESDVLIRATSPREGEFLLLNELQLRYTDTLPRRMRAYAALAEERYKLPVYPILINFLPPARTVTISPCYQSQFMGLRAIQDYQVINLWETDAQIAFESGLSALLPFVPIMQGGGTERLIQQAVRTLRNDATLTDFEPLLAFFATFVLDSALVQQIMRWDMIILEESPWYNEILRRGEERGEKRGRQEGREEGRQEGREEGRQEEATALILRQLARRVGPVNLALQAQVRSLPLEALESLGEAIFDFETIADLITWLDPSFPRSPFSER